MGDDPAFRAGIGGALIDFAEAETLFAENDLRFRNRETLQGRNLNSIGNGAERAWPPGLRSRRLGDLQRLASMGEGSDQVADRFYFCLADPGRAVDRRQGRRRWQDGCDEARSKGDKEPNHDQGRSLSFNLELARCCLIATGVEL
jgi:hypothetical protein